ncbi:hypothetical protein F5X96DRAFT_122342 [Biscogniauxia mediterranea]|nr:hypothetical protein F5X96DRAFT_122342 [Biscogniauxia mediterranea]
MAADPTNHSSRVFHGGGKMWDGGNRRKGGRGGEGNGPSAGPRTKDDRCCKLRRKEREKRERRRICICSRSPNQDLRWEKRRRDELYLGSRDWMMRGDNPAKDTLKVGCSVEKTWYVFVVGKWEWRDSNLLFLFFFFSLSFLVLPPFPFPVSPLLQALYYATWGGCFLLRSRGAGIAG